MYWGKEWLEAADAHNQKQLHNFLGVGTTSITHSCYVEEYQIINICFNIKLEEYQIINISML